MNIFLFLKSLSFLLVTFFIFGSSFLTAGLGVPVIVPAGFFSVVAAAEVTAGFVGCALVFLSSFSPSFFTVVAVVAVVTAGFFSIFLSDSFFSSSPFASSFLTGVLTTLWGIAGVFLSSSSFLSVEVNPAAVFGLAPVVAGLWSPVAGLVTAGLTIGFLSSFGSA